VKEFAFTLAGQPRPIFFAERREDLDDFEEWLRRPRRALAFDTETTDLDIYTPAHGVRLVQFGDTESAWVLPADRAPDLVRRAMTAPTLVAHNATFDLLVLDRYGLLPEDLSAVYSRTFDTSTLAHLLDPRLRSEGGLGRDLKELAREFVDPAAPDGEQALYAEFRKYRDANGKACTKDTGWRYIALDDPVYVTYAGLDTIITARLFETIGPMVREKGLSRLASFEHEFSALCARMERRGVLVDVPYTERLVRTLTEEADRRLADAAALGLDNVNSTAKLAARLLEMGEDLVEKTKTGKPKVDKEVLLGLADLDRDLLRIGAREPNPLAEAVFHGKRAGKWATSYAQAMLDLRDADDRIHPKINSLQARTARMSIARPPLQQLPSGDWTIRRAIIADPGQTIVAADYSQVEMRVLAALSKDRAMLQAIASGQDLHDTVALILFGEGFSKAQRKLAKNVGFGKVYGGGTATLARQSGTSKEVAAQARDMFDRAFPGIKRYARRLQERAQFGAREVVTPSGRHLPLDRDRLYSATNYVVQSTARDVLAQALLDLDEAGLGDHLLLPVHDEVIAQAPTEDAADVAKALGEVMTVNFHGVRLDAEAEVYGPTWGHGYGAKE
jgi:DNA polymerase-1